MASLKHRGGDKYSIIISLGRDEHGKLKQVWHAFRGTKTEALKEKRRLERLQDTGDYVAPSRLTVGQYLDQWLTEGAPRTARSGKTVEEYRKKLYTYVVPALGTVELSRLEPLHLERLYNRLLAGGRADGSGGLSERTVLHVHRILSRALSQAIKWQLLGKNPCAGVEAPRPPKTKGSAQSVAETRDMLAAAQGSALYVPVLIAVTTGLRRGEILALRWADLDLAGASLTIGQSLEQTVGSLRFKSPKTETSGRSLTIPTELVEALRVHQREQFERRQLLGDCYRDLGLICCRSDGRPWRPDAFSTEFGQFLKKHNLPHVRFHDLRHTHASQLIAAGVHLTLISRRLGHATIGITSDTYGHVIAEVERAAADVMERLYGQRKAE